MYFPSFPKRFKRQEELVANHAQSKGMLHLKTAPNQTANVIEVDAPGGAAGGIFSCDPNGNLTSPTTSTTILGSTVRIGNGSSPCTLWLQSNQGSISLAGGLPIAMNAFNGVSMTSATGNTLQVTGAATISGIATINGLEVTSVNQIYAQQNHGGF